LIIQETKQQQLPTTKYVIKITRGLQPNLTSLNEKCIDLAIVRKYIKIAIRAN
jgi:hypothetical protein